jgi:crossover junction endodeoxyribonuclease RuvC
MTTSSGSHPTSISRPRSWPRCSRSPLVLGVDPGSRRTGYGLLSLEGDRPRYERSGVITPRASLPFCDRLLAVYDGLLALLDETRPEEVAVETAFVRKSALAALQIGHVRGVILLAARQRGAVVYEYTAPEVKMAVARHGAAAKGQVGFMVRRLLPGVGTLREDEADALAVALCHVHRTPIREALARGLGAHGRIARRVEAREVFAR